MKTPWWFMHKTPLALILTPVSMIYLGASRITQALRGIGAYKPRRPVVCVGNILAGGVGKTPIVRAIAEFLDAPVVMRGYKKSANTAGIGDEALMLARGGLTLHTGDRKSNIILLDKQAENGPIVMDDGLQNPRVKKTISIMVFDEGIGYGNGFILPAGPLREPKKAARRADAIIVVKSKKPRRKFILPDGVPVFYAVPGTVSPYGPNTRLVAFAGIGYPKKFFNALRGVVASRAFADHYQYTDADLEKLYALARRKKAKLVTTEKDWVRLPECAREKIKYAPLTMQIEGGFFQWLTERLKNA